MQGFDDRLNDRQTWALLHYLRALGAGEMLKASGAWAQPVHLPDMQLRCQNAELRSPGAWKGQRLLLTTTDPSELLPDPRMATFWLPANGQEPQRIPDQVDCEVTSVKDAQLAIALVNGASQVNDLQLLTDRGGRLRARNPRGAAAWTDDDLVCKAPVSDATPGAAPHCGRRTHQDHPPHGCGAGALCEGGRVH